MSSNVSAWFRHFLPARSSVDATERLRACGGALLGIAVTGAVSAWFLGADAAAFWLIAPMGASAVLLFAVPASPLAQPWSIIGGNTAAALVGVTAAHVIPSPVAAAAVAIFVAIGLMFPLRCLHPPSGAVALTAVLGGPAVAKAGYAFVAVPVLLNSVLILLVALVYNNLTKRRYPHQQQADGVMRLHTQDRPPTARLGFDAADLQQVLKDFNQVLDISPDDLEEIFLRTERQAYRRRFGDVRAGEIMSRDLVTVVFGTELGEAWQLMNERGIHALPVVDSAHHVIGILTRHDFLVALGMPVRHRTMIEGLRTLLTRTPRVTSDKHEVVGQIMSRHVDAVREDTPIDELVPIMSDRGHHHVPVMDATGRLVGIVTQSDLLAALYEAGLGKLAAPRVRAA